jgi:hypothetical protein
MERQLKRTMLRRTFQTMIAWVLVVAIGAAVVWFSNAEGAQGNRQQVPLFEPDPLWSQTLPNKWVSGQVGGVTVDSHDNLWIFHRPDTIPDGEKAASLNPPQAECCIPAPAVLQFDTNGRIQQSCAQRGRDQRRSGLCGRPHEQPAPGV